MVVVRLVSQPRVNRDHGVRAFHAYHAQDVAPQIEIVVFPGIRVAQPVMAFRAQDFGSPLPGLSSGAPGSTRRRQRPSPWDKRFTAPDVRQRTTLLDASEDLSKRVRGGGTKNAKKRGIRR